MSLGISVGDIILCAQIAHRLFISITRGRKQAPQDLKELQGALFGLYCTLNILKREFDTVMVRAPFEHGAALECMIQSCQETLHELDNATAQYREAASDPNAAIGPIRTYLRVQWKRIMWGFRGDTLSKYRQKLQMHTDSLNLLLNTFLWSATGRIEDGSRSQEQRLNELLQQASRFNDEFQQSMRTLQATMQPTQRHHILGSRVSMCLTG
ncbi:hypothetical protein N7481_011177 [Penicillium waksmanii]|uniref:uncharacterized protein n=1 Tax=Penicillium waksmanii TaxID=69791 RepID=UPI002548F381|nr:uncharacterized protein N7481_011177 [Penicillium waksmanii]KAJ5973967.1 hypothetical protein N7481_011177 [Penicillium waksmanii]